MSSTFPRVRKGRGYDPAEVEDFLEDARRAYGAPAGQAGLTADGVRTTAFSMKRGGYDPAADAWTPTAPMQVLRAHAGATLLPDGSVLACGGAPDSAGVDCEAWW